MNLARIAIHNSRITLIGMFMLVAVGITTFLNYPSAEDPTIEPPPLKWSAPIVRKAEDQR